MVAGTNLLNVLRSHRLKTGGACFFNSPFQLKPTNNTPIPQIFITQITLDFYLDFFPRLIATYLNEIFRPGTDLEASIWSPDILNIDHFIFVFVVNLSSFLLFVDVY